MLASLGLKIRRARIVPPGAIWLFIALVTLAQWACVDIKVPNDGAVQFDGIAGINRRADGVYVLTWSAATAKDAGDSVSYEIYMSELDSAPAGLTDTVDVQAVLGQWPEESTPHTKGTLLGTTSERTYELKEPLTVSKYYAFQVLANAAGQSDENTKVATFQYNGAGASDSVAPEFDGLQALSMTANPLKVLLTWKRASDNVTLPQNIEYRVYRIPAGGNFAFADSEIIATTKTVTYVDTTVTENVSYLYVVRAVDEAGNADVNFNVMTSPKDIQPPTFSGCGTAAAVNSSSINITWTPSPSSDVMQYNIYLTTDLTKPIGSTDDSEYLVTGLKEQTTYSFICRAVDLEGNAEENRKIVKATTLANSDDVNLQNGDSLPPQVRCFQVQTAPVFNGIQSVTTVQSSGGYILRVVVATPPDTNGDVGLYQIYAVESTADKLLQFRGSGNPTTTVEIPVPAGTGDTLTLAAAKSGAGRWECGRDQQQVTIDRTPPFFTGCGAVTAISHNAFTITWNQALQYSGGPTEAGVNYFVYSTSNLSQPLTTTTATSVTVKEKAVGVPLTPGMNAEYVCRARDANGNEDTNLHVVSGSTYVTAVPDFLGVTSVQAAAGEPGLGAIRLTWQSPTWPNSEPTQSSGQIGYYIYMEAKNDTTGATGESTVPLDYSASPLFIPRNILSGKNEYTVSGLSACNASAPSCKRYCFTVRAVDKRTTPFAVEGNGVVKCASTTVFTVPTFSGLASAAAPASIDGFTAIDLLWPAATGTFYEYRVFMKPSTTPSFNLGTYISVAPTTTSYRYSGLTANTNYDFMVLAAYDSDPNHTAPLVAGPQTGAAVKTSVKTTPPKPSFAGLQSIEAAPGVPGFDSLKMTFYSASGAFNRYNIYKRAKNGGSYGTPPVLYQVFVPPTGVPPEVLTANVTGLTFNSEYCVWATAAYADVPDDIASPTLLESANDTLSEACALVTPVPPVFLGVDSVASSDATQGNSASIKITFPKATGLFNRYRLYVDTASPPTTLFATLSSDLVKVSGSGVVDTCAAASGQGCLTLKGLTFDTSYNITVRAVYEGAVTLLDNAGDDTAQPVAYTTPAAPPFLVADAIFANFTAVAAAQIPKTTAVDSDVLTSSLTTASNGYTSVQDYYFSAPPGMTWPTDLVEITPKGTAWGKGDNASAQGYGAALGIYKFDQLGTARDGALVVNGTFIIDSTINPNNSRSSPDAVTYALSSSSVISGTATVTTTATPTGFAVGDEVLIYFKQVLSGGGSTTDVGSYHWTTISSISGTTITLTTAPPFSGVTNAVISIQRVPHYSSVTMNGTLMVSPFDNGTGKGGVLAFRSQGDVNLGGMTIDAKAAGYHGGSQGAFCSTSYQGDGLTVGGQSSSANGIGGGASGSCGGDQAGGGGGNAGGGVAGMRGSSTIASAGLTTGSSNLTKIFFGGGGGGSTNTADPGRCAGPGANGGGVVIIFAKSIRNGTIDASGGAYSALSPPTGFGGDWGGGAGAGGTVWLGSVDIVGVTTNVSGGPGSPTMCSNVSGDTYSAAGGSGRIRVDALQPGPDANYVLNLPTPGAGDQPIGGAGTLFKSNANLYFQSLISNTADSLADADLLTDPSLSTNLSAYLNSAGKIAVRAYSLYPQSGSFTSTLTTDRVQLWYSRAP